MKKIIPYIISLRQLELNKIDKLYYNIEGVKKVDKGKFNEAIKYFTKAIELEPKDATSYFNRATVKMNIGDLIGASSDFKLSERCQLSI